MHVRENRMHIIVSHFDFLNMCHADGFVLINFMQLAGQM